MRRSFFSYKDLRKNQIIGLLLSLSIHLLVVFGLMFYIHNNDKNNLIANEAQFGGSGGGGGEGAEDDEIQFGPQGPTKKNDQGTDLYGAEFNLIQIHVYDDITPAKPIPKKEESKPKSLKKHKQKQIVAADLPTRWIRRGTGSGSGGGAGGGSGGGIGAGQGYSIDWGGEGSRRLLSGRLPKYPDGTDKQMSVALQFSVLPDGSVGSITPIRKTDELLERAAISALETWRFEPLPVQLDQLSQLGKITFKFVLKKE